MIALLLLCVSALADGSVGATWNPDDWPVPYWIDSDLSSDVDDAAAVAAIQAGFATWEAVDCMEVRFAYQGRADADFPGVDGRNVVHLVDWEWPDDPALVSTPRVVTAGNDLVEIDFALNGEFYVWATDGADGLTVMDVQSSVTHQVSHVLGLWHVHDADSSLSAAMDGHPDGRTLEEHDIEALCALYETVLYDGAQGDRCEEHDDCAADLTCLRDDGSLYCAETCALDADDCGEGFTCEEVDEMALCVKELPEVCGCASSSAEGGAAGWLTLLVLTLLRRRT